MTCTDFLNSFIHFIYPSSIFPSPSFLPYVPCLFLPSFPLPRPLLPSPLPQLSKAGWSIDDVNLFELNEAFAAQSLAVLRELGIDQQKVLSPITVYMSVCVQHIALTLTDRKIRIVL